MREIKKEISKEFYDKCMSMTRLEMKREVCDFVGDAVVAGYGLYGFDFINDKDKYYLSYTTGDSCD